MAAETKSKSKRETREEVPEYIKAMSKSDLSPEERSKKIFAMRESSFDALEKYFVKIRFTFDYYGVPITFRRVMSLRDNRVYRISFSAPIVNFQNLIFELTIPKQAFVDAGILNEKEGYYSMNDSANAEMIEKLLSNYMPKQIESQIMPDAPEPIVLEPEEESKNQKRSEDEKIEPVIRVNPAKSREDFEKILSNVLANKNDVSIEDTKSLADDVLNTSESYVLPKNVNKSRIKSKNDIVKYLGRKQGNEIVRFVPAKPTMERPINIIAEILRAAGDDNIETVDKIAITQSAEQLQKCGFKPEAVADIARKILEARKKGLYKSRYEEELHKPKGKLVSRKKELETIRKLKKEDTSLFRHKNRTKDYYRFMDRSSFLE